MCLYDGCLDTWTFFVFLFKKKNAIVQRDAFALFVRVKALYKTSVLLLLLFNCDNVSDNDPLMMYWHSEFSTAH